MVELWKSIEGLEGLYEISNLGRVKSLARKAGNVFRKERLLIPREDAGGYLSVSIGLTYAYKNRRIHRLVAEAFLSNPEKLPQVNHIDEDKHHNFVDNLEWVTAQQNMTHDGVQFSKWNGRRRAYQATNLKSGEVIDFLNTESYKEMESFGFTKAHRTKANRFGVAHTTFGYDLKPLK